MSIPILYCWLPEFIPILGVHRFTIDREVAYTTKLERIQAASSTKSEWTRVDEAVDTSRTINCTIQTLLHRHLFSESITYLWYASGLSIEKFSYSVKKDLKSAVALKGETEEL